MTIDINSVGMEKGQQYETIITTVNKEGIKNAAPIGVIARGNDEVMCRIFNTSTTLKNIINQKEFVINILTNPLMFTLSTIDNIPLEYFKDEKNIAILNNNDAYLKCVVTDLKEATKKNDPVRKTTPATIIKAKVVEMKINSPCPKAINRGIHLLIESLVNYTRIDIVDNEKQDYYLGRLKEAQRVIRKVGSKEEKEAIKILKESLKNKGYKI